MPQTHSSHPTHQIFRLTNPSHGQFWDPWCHESSTTLVSRFFGWALYSVALLRKPTMRSHPWTDHPGQKVCLTTWVSINTHSGNSYKHRTALQAPRCSVQSWRGEDRQEQMLCSVRMFGGDFWSWNPHKDISCTPLNLEKLGIAEHA